MTEDNSEVAPKEEGIVDAVDKVEDTVEGAVTGEVDAAAPATEPIIAPDQQAAAHDAKVTPPAHVAAPSEQWVPTDPFMVPADAPEKLDHFCLLIQTYEGYEGPEQYPPKGTLAFQYNNPGNLRFVGQAHAYESKESFCVFDTYAHGYLALRGMILNIISGKSRAYPNPTIVKTDGRATSTHPITIEEVFAIYAPAKDKNNPAAYGAWIAAKLGVDTSFPINDLVA